MADLREACNCTRLQDLPEEILERIMWYLSPYDDYKNASLVSKRWHRLMQGVVKQREQAFCLAARAGCLQWSHKESDGNSLFGRSMHSACYVDGIMYMFGGCIPSPQGATSGTCYCDLQKLDLGKRIWTRLMAAGEYPSPKAAASMVHHSGSLILFGGWAPPVPNPPHQPPHISDDLHIYDIAKNRWRSVVIGICPPPMASHRASMVGDLMVIFGGSGGNQRKYNDVWVLSLPSMTWSCMQMEGKKPPARDKHVQVVLDDGHILIIGGLGNYDKELTDVWMLDISEVPWCWREITITQQEHAAPKIFSHAACKIGECVVFFSSLRTSPSLAINSNALPPRTRPLHRPSPPASTQSCHSPRPQGGVERGSLRDLHRDAKRLCSKARNEEVNSDPNAKDYSSSETDRESSDQEIPIGCPCSPDCQCKTPVTHTINPSRNRTGCCKSPAKLGFSPPLYSKIPHGEQQYVLDVSSAVSDSQVVWLEIPDQNAKRNPLNPSHPDAEMMYGYAPEALFSSVCVGRAEVIRFGGILKASASYPRALNGQYFAY